MEIVVIAALIGLIPAFIAKSKGRAFGLWWFYGTVCFIIALPHSIIMPSDKGIAENSLAEASITNSNVKSDVSFTSEVRVKKQEETQKDYIDSLKLSSSEKIKLVKIQPLKVEDKEVIEAKRKSKRYTIMVTPQALGAIAFNESATITVFVIAGSKEEAIEYLSQEISGYYPYYPDSNPNKAECGKWYNGDKCSLEIIKFEKNA